MNTRTKSKAIFICITILLTFLVSFVHCALAEEIKGNTTGKVNLRKMPSRQSEVVTIVNVGISVSILAKQKNENELWYHVKYGDYDGYIVAKYIDVSSHDVPWINDLANEKDKMQESQKENFKCGTVLTEGLDLKSKPDIASVNSAYLKNGESVVIISITDDKNWAYVFYGDHYGYMNLEYLEITDFTTTSEGTILYDNTEIKNFPYNKYYEVSGNLNQGEIVDIYANCSGHYSIMYDGKLRYVKSDSVKLLNGHPRTSGIILKGEPTIIVGLGESYNDPGFVAYDEVGNDVTEDVYVYGSVMTSRLDTYKIQYNYDFMDAQYKEKVYREVSVVHKIDAAKVKQLEENKTANNKQEWKKATYVSSTGLVSVDIWIDDIIDGKAVIKTSYSWLGNGESNIYLVEPSLMRTYSNPASYQARESGTYQFVLYEDDVPTLKYSIEVNGVSLSEISIANDFDSGINSDERNFLRDMKKIGFPFDGTMMYNIVTRLMPFIRQSKSHYVDNGIQEFTFRLMYTGDHEAIAKLLNGEVKVDNTTFKNLSDCYKSYFICILYAYEFNEVRVPDNEEALNQMIVEYIDRTGNR